MSATIGFVNSLGVFDEDYYATQNNTFVNYEVSDLDDYGDIAEEPGLGDYAEALWGMAWDGLWMVMRVMFAIVWIYGDMVTVFEIPAGIAALLQVCIYLIYYMGWAQYKSGKSFEGFQ